MQTVIQVTCESGPSLRQRIEGDTQQLDRHKLIVVRKRKEGQTWAKLKSNQEDRQGALNFEWVSATNTLTCRVVNRAEGKPDLLVGDFVQYLLAHHSKQIKLLTIIPGNQNNQKARGK